MAEPKGPRQRRSPADPAPSGQDVGCGAKLVSYEQVIGLVRAFNEGISKGAIQRVLRPLRADLVKQIAHGSVGAYSVGGRVPDILTDRDALLSPMGFDMPGVYLRARIIAQHADLVGMTRIVNDGLLPGGAGFLIAFGRALRASHDYAAEIGEKLACFNRNGMGAGGGGDSRRPERNDFIQRETELRPAAPLFHYPN